MEEMTVEEFKAKGLKIPKPKKPDRTWDRFVSAVGLFCISKEYDLPTKEYRFHKPRRWAFDLAWPRYHTSMEREGGTWSSTHDPEAKSRHTTGIGYRNDCEKYSQAAIDGWIVIRATTDMLRDGTALDLLARALAEGSTRHGGSEWEAPVSSAARHSRPSNPGKRTKSPATPPILTATARGRRNAKPRL